MCGVMGIWQWGAGLGKDALLESPCRLDGLNGLLLHCGDFTTSVRSPLRVLTSSKEQPELPNPCQSILYPWNQSPTVTLCGSAGG